MTSNLQTNRDLYCIVTDALKRRSRTARSLEAYLSRLREMLASREGCPMTTEDFARALDSAFLGPAPVADLAALRELAGDERMPAWHRQLAQQIVDLREMAEAGILEDEYRYFGVNAPSGARWYNFDPHTFVECGLAGSFGGWAPCDDTGRAHAPGKVAVVGEHGELTTANPEDLEEPIVSVQTISWDALAEFLWAGQCYE